MGWIGFGPEHQIGRYPGDPNHQTTARIGLPRVQSRFLLASLVKRPQNGYPYNWQPRLVFGMQGMLSNIRPKRRVISCTSGKALEPDEREHVAQLGLEGVVEIL